MNKIAWIALALYVVLVLLYMMNAVHGIWVILATVGWVGVCFVRLFWWRG